MSRLPIYVGVLLALLNLSVLAALALDFGHGHVGAGLGKLAALLALDALGVWLLRTIRED